MPRNGFEPSLVNSSHRMCKTCKPIHNGQSHLTDMLPKEPFRFWFKSACLNPTQFQCHRYHETLVVCPDEWRIEICDENQARHNSCQKVSVHILNDAVGSPQTSSKRPFLKDVARSVRVQLDLLVCGYVSAWLRMARFSERAINLKRLRYRRPMKGVVWRTTWPDQDLLCLDVCG